MAAEIKKIEGWYNRVNASQKLVVSLVAGALTGLIYQHSHWEIRLLLGWDITSFLLIVLIWAGFFATRKGQTRLQATKQDESRVVSFVFILVASTLSLLGIGILLIQKHGASSWPKWVPVFPLASICLSWVLIHTLFTVRYAHLFYRDKNLSPEKPGLVFPGDDHPDFFDFAYFSFVIGMTFQVSDVNIVSKKIRKIALIQGVLAFMFNTFIVALLINLIAGSMG